jgi:hypothetical protein
MSYAMATAAIQPKTGTTLIDFVAGPFASASRAVKLSVLKAMLPLFEQYPAHNEVLIASIIAEIKILTSQQLGGAQ